ncbi:hypothetical protein FQN57_002360 [Myotisia sp. PD_48]|nr:hypothetical protein FQN57_002360 [Myotisia sp. PD_48]
MASDMPDAQSLNTWEEAFQYPIPTVRRVERDLRRDAEINRDKLRSFVGVKYRELLSTAETIVEMNREIKAIESNLADIGRRCNPRLIARKSAHLTELKGRMSKEVRDEQRLSAHFAFLRKSTDIISRILRKRGPIVVVAKLLVISRLLLKELSQCETLPGYVENLRNSLASFRQILLKRVNSRLIAIDITTADLLDAFSAYCLATSSSSGDAMRHFHRIRQEAINSQVERTGSRADGIVLALKLYLQTLQNTTALLSGPLATSLEKLTSKPLLSDPDVLQIRELDIDVVKPWIIADIQHFTPWIKYNEISRSDGERQVKAWSKAAFEGFLTYSRREIEFFQTFREVLELRKRLLETWLTVQNSTCSHSPLEILDGLQGLVNGQLVFILRSQSEGLAGLGQEISILVEERNTEDADNDNFQLWDSQLTFLDFSEGAKGFKEALLNRYLGRGTNLLKFMDLYQRWLESIHTHTTLVQDLRNEIWEDIIEDDVDEDIIDHINGCLKEDDPDHLSTEHHSALEKGFTSLQASLISLSNKMTGPESNPRATFLLRIIRGIQTKIPNEVFPKNQPEFASEVIPKLHTILAAAVVSQTSKYLLHLNPQPNAKRLPGRLLWVGEPELPVQPTPTAFKLLRHLVLAMANQGSDIWNPSAVGELKKEFFKSVASTIKVESTDDVNGSNESVSHENENDLPVEENLETVTAVRPSTRDFQLQLLFDLMYLYRFMAVEKPSTDSTLGGLHPIIESLIGGLELGPELRERLETSSHRYWERTRLLFALLE